MFDFPSGISGFLAQMVIADSHSAVSYVIQSNSVNTDTEGPSKVSVVTGCPYIKRVELERMSVRTFFPQGQRKLSQITRCP